MRVTLDGTLKKAYPLPVHTYGNLVRDPKGNVWIDYYDFDTLATGLVEIRPTGKMVWYQVPAQDAGVAVRGTIVGPDGNPWFLYAGKEAFIATLVEGAFVKYRLPNSVRVDNLVAGADGAIWYGTGKSIGRMSLHGKVLPSLSLRTTVGRLAADRISHDVFFVSLAPSNTLYTIDSKLRVTSKQFACSQCNLNGITDMSVAAGGIVWMLTDCGLTRVVAAGPEKCYYLPDAYPGAQSLVAAPDGNVWVLGNNGAVYVMNAARYAASGLPYAASLTGSARRIDSAVAVRPR